ncbi:hypothetical protein [Paraburkholderia bryophila]|uniref:Uncharacterized protein n=1 Tax=Paraburkholderia bryophila TaxID=420952 RepID=A0A7Y9WPJ5_9BURK|nr:hypothetical protein [Paraburkholderia bryophila]NYH24702.1 hypothetical protein [Paraburkholderia bryophila]
MEKETAAIVGEFVQFVADLRAQQNAGTVGFEGDNIAEIIGRQAQAVAESFLGENALSLLMHCAKMVLGFLIAAEQSAMPVAASQENIALVITKTAEALEA